MGDLSRRRFLGSAAAATAAAASPLPLFARSTRPGSPNSRLRIAQIGVKGRGDTHVGTYLKMPDLELAAVCDVDKNVSKGALEKIAQANGKPPDFYQDARKLMEDKSIDAISIATTNHTHSYLAMLALQAGKHVYVEKPMSHTVWEGRKVVEAQKKYGKVVAHGTQCRSMTGIKSAMAYLHAGNLGAVKVARGLCYKGRGPMEIKQDAPIPEGVDYDLWLGPAPQRPFNANRFHYNWHWFWDYGNGDIGNQGVHEMDKCIWGLNKKTLPTGAISVGGRLGIKDQGETAHTQVAILDYGDSKVVFEVRGHDTDGYEAIPGKTEAVKIGNVFDCEKGYMVFPTYSSCIAYDLEGKILKRFGGGSFTAHFQNFVDAVKANKPESVNANALDGHLSSSLCHLANISYRVGESRPLSAKEAFGGDAAGNEAFGRMVDHLRQNGVDAARESYVQGAPLKVDPAVEAIVDNPAASKLLRRDYRKGFEVPETP